MIYFKFIVIMNSLTGFLQSEIEANVKEQLIKSLTAFDDNFQLLDAISVHISLNENLRDEPTQNDHYGNMMVCRELEKCMFANAFYKDVMLYYRGSDIIHTQLEADSLSTFFRVRTALKT